MATDPEIVRRIAALERTVYDAVDPTARASATTALTSAGDASTAAATAQATASSAQSTANSAASQASTAQTTANGKNTVYRQTSTPTGGSYTTGDLWFDTDDGNKVYQWTGTSWVSAVDASIAAAQSAANAAQTTANGRNRIYRQTSQPTGGTYVAGDTWFDSDGDNKAYVYDGSTWQPSPFGNLAVANLDAGAITTGTLAAARIATTALNADNLTSGTIAAARITTASLASAAIDAGNITTGNLTALSYYSKSSGSNRIIMGPTITEGGTWSSIHFDITGDGPSADDPTISAPSGKFLLKGFTSGSAYSRITIGDAIGGNSPYDVVIQSQSNTAGGTASNLVISGANDHVRVSRTLQVDGNIATNGTLIQNSASTTTNGANLNIGSPSNIILRINSSSRRYKRDIAPLGGGDLDCKRLYALPVRQFKFKPGHVSATDRRANVDVPGFVAEEVAEHYPMAADLNENGEVEDWNFRYLMPAYLALIQDLNRRVTSLESPNPND